MPFKKKKIAIVGMACRLPGGIESPDDYWQVLKQGTDVVTSIDSSRWGTDFYQHPDKKEPGKSYTFAAGVLSRIDQFDASFFGISPREAAQMDPQQRLLLELTWEALENGGQIPANLAGSDCAVYIGIASTDYAHRRMDDLCSLDPYSMTGNTASIASNRISYLFDLHGPSVSVDTACSSSLVALHQACSCIWNGDTSMALAGGVNMLLHPFGFVGFSKASMLSPQGRCRAFDDSGDGYVRAEGAGILFLKPLEDALAEGDPVQAIIVESGINSDGLTNGISLPSQQGQCALLEKVYGRAGVDPESITYIEAHGTGTAVGDPIETAALAQALAKHRRHALPIGSAKTNVGHLETASGMAGIFKLILSLQHRALPASLHFQKPNRHIDFNTANLKVVDTFTPLDDTTTPLLMGVNSFGFGGANAHVLLEEFQVETMAEVHSLQPPGFPPLFLSANSEPALRAMAQQYTELLHQQAANYYDIAYTAVHYRQALKYGIAVDGQIDHKASGTAIVKALHRYAEGTPVHDIPGMTEAVRLVPATSVQTPRLALVFSGNGSQWQGMGCELLQTEPLFRTTVDEINTLLLAQHPDSQLCLMEAFLASPEASSLHYTETAQLLLFALQVGVIRILRSRGLQADAVLGHSVGEVSAAWAAGALSLEQAVSVIYERSHAQGETRGSGRMAAAGLGLNAMQAVLQRLGIHDRVTIAGINSPNAVTLAGTFDDLQRIGQALQDQGSFYRILDLDYAFHSPQMRSIETRIRETLSGLCPQKNHTRFISTVTGGEVSGENLDASYWWENIRKPVLFEQAMNTALDTGITVFLEIGPQPILRGYINDCLRNREITGRYIPTLSKKEDSRTALLEKLYQAFLAGCPLKLSRLYPQKGQFIKLPNYPWQRERHWYTVTREGLDLVSRERQHPLLGYPEKDSLLTWSNELDLHKFPYLQDHVVDNGVVFPAAGYIEMALAASLLQAGAHTGQEPCEIENLEIRSPMLLDHTRSTRFTLSAEDGSFHIESRDRLSDAAWTLNVTGRLPGKSFKQPQEALDIPQLIRHSRLHISASGHYQLTGHAGLDYGSSFQAVAEVWLVSSSVALARLTTPASITDTMKQYYLHPGLLDAGFQVLVDIFANTACDGMSDHEKPVAFIPIQVGKTHLHSPLVSSDADSAESEKKKHEKGERKENIKAVKSKDRIPAYVQAQVRRQNPRSVLADFIFCDAQGQVLAELMNCRFKRIHIARQYQSELACYIFSSRLMPHASQQLTAPSQHPEKWVQQALDKLQKAARQQQRQLHFQQILPLFDVMVAMFAWQAMRELQAAAAVSKWFMVEDLLQAGVLDARYTPLCQRILRFLETSELAIQKETHWQLEAEPGFPAAETIWLSILGDSPDYLPELVLLARCGQHLAAVLGGKTDPVTLLSPAKSRLLEHWYQASPSHDAINRSLLQLIRQMVADWPSRRRLRILQLGADTGLTRQILPLLPPTRCDYVFASTDEQCVSEASMTLESWDFVHTRMLDIDSPAPDIGNASFDMVIATHSLHLCASLPHALRQLHQCLTRNGLLLLLDRQPDTFTDFTLGLDPQWWKYSETDAEPLSLLLSLNEWQAQLQATHFTKHSLLTEPQALMNEGAFLLLATATTPADSDTGKTANDMHHSDIICQHWLLLVSTAGYSQTVGQLLKKSLEGRQQQVTLLTVPESTQQDTLASFFASTAIPAADLDHIIQLTGLDDWQTKSESSPQQREQPCHPSVYTTLQLVQSLIQQSVATPPQLWLLTSNAAVLEWDNEPEPAAVTLQPALSPLWGFGRVLMNEHPELNTRLLDLRFAAREPDIVTIVNALAAECLEETGSENEILLSFPDKPENPRDYQRHVLRMQQTSLDSQAITVPENTPAIRLAFATPGSLGNLYWQPLPKRPLGANEIEIQTCATGLNFRDVMYAMGMLSDEAVEDGFAGATLGMELAGKVTRVGSDITHYTIGDKVMGFAPACFGSRVITQTTALAPMPDNWSYAEAATVPTTFFTVYYALSHLAQLQPGEKILIHGAAGGVGIAAIQFARYRGAEIFATAGTEEKREFVRLLGADHVFDSRSLAFADEILATTAGAGVDVVLNSLAGEAIRRNLSILKPFGRFLELGKRDFYENSKIGLRPFRNNISYFAIDADQLLIEREALASKLFREMMKLFTAGVLRPLPYRVFPAIQVEDAFRYMQQSQQIGKVVVSFTDTLPPPRQETVLQTVSGVALCQPDASYLVTGGLSGFGLQTALWLEQKGAKNLILASRTGQANKKDTKLIEALQNKGVNVYQRACDITDSTAVNQLFTEFGRTLPPLKGIIHAAMVLDDGLIRNLTQKQFDHVIAPKATGAWNCHQCSLAHRQQLDFFVLYSSVTTYLGNPGQANYVAANYFLEALASYRRSQGLAATHVAWGAIEDVGFLAKNKTTREALQARLGGTPLTSGNALKMLDKLLQANHPGVAVIDMDWSVIQRAMPAAGAPKYREQQRQVKQQTTGQEDIHLLIANKSADEVQQLVTARLLTEFEQILRLPKDRLDTNLSVFDLGMDSLMGMELVLAIETRFGVRLPVMALTEGATIQRIAERIVQQLLAPADITEHAEPCADPVSEQHQEAITIAATRHAETVDSETREQLARTLKTAP